LSKQHSIVIKYFKCDLGGEHTSNKLCELFALNGTIHQILCTDTLNKIKLLKKHRFIVKITIFFLLFASVFSKFWGEVVNKISIISKNTNKKYVAMIDIRNQTIQI